MPQSVFWLSYLFSSFWCNRFTTANRLHVQRGTPFICLVLRALRFVGSTVTFPVEYPRCSTSTVMFRSLPGSDDARRNIASVLCFLTRGGVNHVDPKCVISTIYYDFDTGMEFYSRIKGSIALPSSRPTVVVVYTTFLPFAIIINFVHMPSLYSVTSQ